MKIYKSIDEMIGKTPLLYASRFAVFANSFANIYAKLESFNPAGSVKDRVALRMINDAEQSGLLKSGGTIIEPTSGNTGIGLAAVGVMRGYRVIIVMPDTMSEERRQLIRAYGAELVLTNGESGMKGAIAEAQRLCAEISGAFMPSQFENPSNPDAHADTTGPEIWDDTDGRVDILVAGVGTGGTLSGIGRYLKSKNKDIKIVAAEPYDSPVLSGGCACAHDLQGIGAGFIPKTLDTTLCDEIITVKSEEAYAFARAFTRCEGVLVGISSGAALSAAAAVAGREENRGKNIVVILPDGGDKYLSTSLFDE